MEKKMTKRDYFNQLLAMDVIKADSALVAFISHEIELLDNRKKSDKPTKTQAENQTHMNELYKELSALDKAITISELMAKGGYASTLSNQKISALFKLMDGTRVERAVVKGKAYFKAIQPLALLHKAPREIQVLFCYI